MSLSQKRNNRRKCLWKSLYLNTVIDLSINDEKIIQVEGCCLSFDPIVVTLSLQGCSLVHLIGYTLSILKFYTHSAELSTHISHYWIVQNSNDIFLSNSKVYGYPGIRPEIILIIKGYLTYTYLGTTHKTNKSILASHINGNFLFDSSNLDQFIIIQFKPRSLSSLLPFTNFSSKQLMHNSLCTLEDVFGKDVEKLERDLKDISNEECVSILDSFLLKKLSKGYTGFIMEMMYDISYEESIQKLLSKTNYSISTLERHVKKETGMTPKAFLNLKKYKAAVEEIHNDDNYDWQHYVNKYNYTDQSHFIKTIKKYTGFTPTQLMRAPNLISFRPEYY